MDLLLSYFRLRAITASFAGGIYTIYFSNEGTIVFLVKYLFTKARVNMVMYSFHHAYRMFPASVTFDTLYYLVYFFPAVRSVVSCALKAASLAFYTALVAYV